MSREQPTFGDRAGAGLRTGAVVGGVIVAGNAAFNGVRNLMSKGANPHKLFSWGNARLAVGLGLAVGALNFIFRKNVTDHVDQRRENRIAQGQEELAQMSQATGTGQAPESTHFRDMVTAQRAAAAQQQQAR